MGCDWYDFKSVSSSGAAILVRNKDIKQVYAPGSLAADPKPDSFRAPLKDEVKTWLLKQAEGFRLYNIHDSFVLAMHKDCYLFSPPKCIDVPGPYEIEREFWYTQVDMEDVISEDDDQYQALVALARKLTPASKKLAFPPARYHFASAYSSFEMGEITLKEEDGGNAKPNHEAHEEGTSFIPSERIPLDIELVVGEGETKKSIKLNKGVFCCSFPKIEAQVGDLTKRNSLELPDLNVDAVECVIKAYSTRLGEMPSRWDDNFKDVEAVKEKFGLMDQALKKSKENEDVVQTEDALPTALTDPRWLDVTFVVGEKKEEIKANRAVLASRNDVLARILYGTGSISVDMDQPIEWPQFDNVKGVRKVFAALILCGEAGGNAEFTIPLDMVKTAKAVVDYLMESPESLGLYYETLFERKYGGGFRVDYEDEDDDEVSDDDDGESG